MTLGNGTNLDFDLGAPGSSDLIAVNGQLTLGSNIVLNIFQNPGFVANSTYTLITYTGGLSGDTSGWMAPVVPIDTTAVFSVSGSTVTVNFAPTNIPGVAYWGGAQGSGGNGTWNTITSATATNWLTAQTGGGDTTQVPYSTTNVFFIADSGSNVNTVLGVNTTVNSLNFTGTDGVVTTGSAVSIGGSNTLTIMATSANGNTAGSGITTGVGAGAETISANVALGGNQTWTLNSSAPFTVTGTISGSQALTVAGSGQLILGGNNTFTNGLTIDDTASVVLNNAGALNSAAPDSVSFGPSSSGTLNLSGNSVTIGSLSSDPTATSAVIRNGSGTPALLTVKQTSSGTYAGVIRDGAGGGALSLVTAASSSSSLTLAGVNTYTGSTTINGGRLNINGSLSASSVVTVNNTGTLGGSGTVNGAVTVNGGGTINAGTSPTPAVLTLGNGLTLSAGAIAAFDVVNGGANDQINITGAFNFSSGAILEVSQNLSVSGTYALMTYSSISDSSLSGISFENLNGGALTANYSFVANSGTLDLVIVQPAAAFPIINLDAPANGTRLMANTTTGVAGTVLNDGTVNTLSGSLSSTGTLSVTGITPLVEVLGPTASGTFGGTLNTGASLGNKNYAVTVTDGSATPTSATASGTVDVVGNRVITPTIAMSTGSSTVGVVHQGTVVTGTVTLSSTTADNLATRVTVATSAGPDAFGISYSGNNTGTFNGSYSATGTLSGTLSTPGTDTGITLTTTGEGLAGESPINVNVNFNAQVFSGKASWNNTGSNGSWSTNNNWGDTLSAGTPGAPGISGSLSVGDTATFGDYAGETVGGTTTVNLNGVNPSLAGLTFNSTNTSYTIATGTGAGTINLQSGATINVTSGTATIAANITGTGALTISGAAGTDLIWSGSDQTFTGSANITSGTLTLVNPTWFATDNTPNPPGNINAWNIASGAVLQWQGTGVTDVLIGANNHWSAIEGSGTFQITGTSPIFVSNGLLYLGLSSSGVMEITSGGTYVNSGGNGMDTAGIGSVPANQGTLQIDAGGAYNEWNAGTMTFGALTGSGTLTRIGYGNGAGGNIDIGYGGASGTFAGTITNGEGTTYFTKIGAGTEVLTGSNSYSGQTTITGGVLQITNNYGLGWGGQIFTSAGAANQLTTTISGTTTSGSGILDLHGNMVINEVVQLTGSAGLTNSAAGTTAIFDSGIVGVTFPTDPNSSGTNGITFAGGSGTGAAATEGQETIYAGFPVGGGSADYVQMQNAGSGYTTGSGAPTVTLTVGGSNAGLGAITAQVSSIALSGNGNTIGGAGNLLINAQITGASGFTTAGSGTVTLTANELYTGATSIASGVLVANGSLPGAVNVNGGTLSGTGVIASAVTVNSGAVDPGVIGGGGTLTLGNGLTLGGGTSLVYDLGTTQNLIAVTGQLTLGSGVVLNFTPTSALVENSPYTLITYTGALTGDTTGWTASGSLPPASTAVFSSGSGVVTVNFAPINVPGVAYWGGALGGGGNGTWNTMTSATATNWLSAQSSGSDTLQTPYSPTNVFFIANSGSNVNTVLGINITINSLNFTGTNGVVTTGSAVTIGGNKTLTINATGTNGNTAGSGITTGVGAGAETINANVALGGNQTWTLNSSAPFTVSGSISGAHALTVGGNGQLVLAGNDTFTGGLTINGSASVVLNNAGALNSASPDSVSFGASSSGALDLNGNSVAIGSLASASSATSAVVQNANATAALLTVNQTSSGTFAGILKDGVGGGALSVTMADPSTLTLTGVNTYTGSTTVNAGTLNINGSLGASSVVAVNGGTLGGTGTIGGAVTVNNGGTINAGTGPAPAILTLGNGLTLNTGGIAAFEVVNGGANDEINISGGLTLNSGAILQVSPFLTLGGTYALMTYGSISNPSLAGITEQDLGGGALQANYSIVANSGTLELIVTATNAPIASISITSPASGGRVMAGTHLTVSGSVSNLGTGNNLSGTLSNNGGTITTGDFTPPPVTVPAGTSVAYTGTATTGTSAGSLGTQTIGVAITDGSALPPTAATTESVDVVANRVVTPTIAMSTGSSTVGAVHVGTVVSGTVTLSSTTADNLATRVTVANSGADAFGISYAGNNTGTFNGSYSATGTLSGTLNTLGTDTGLTLTTTGEGLAGESPINVNLNFNAQVFSGKASWNNIAGDNVWTSNNNWGDTMAPTGTPGAPGLSGSLSVGDTATFGDFVGESSTTVILLNGVSPSLAGLKFSGTNTNYRIVGSGSSVIAMQDNGTMNITNGTAEIAATISGNGSLTVSGSAGTDLIWSGSNSFTGPVNVTSGTLTLRNPDWLAQTAGANVYNINSGAVLQWDVENGSFLTDTAAQTGTVQGSGTLQVVGNGGFYLSTTKYAISMSAGGVIEIGNGANLGNGGNGGGGIVWTNNLGSLKVDAGGFLNVWNNAGTTVDALTGSGTVTKDGFTIDPGHFTMGVNNGSGTFAGTIANGLGTLSITKEGSGTEVLTGINTYSGSTAVTGGVLKITNNSGLGFGGQTFATEGANITGQHTAVISGGGTLDISGSLDINEAITLNGGSLVNNTVGSTSILDSGIAGISFANDVNSQGAAVVTFSGTTASGSAASGSGAAVTGGYVNNSFFPTVYGNADGSATANDYLQVTASGSGYTPGAGAPVVTVTFGGAGTGANTVVVSSLTLTGNNNYLGGNGGLTINAQINGTGGFTTIGTGTVTLTAAETYTGETTLGVGSTLQLGTGYSSVGVIGGAGSVIVAGNGTQVFAGVNTYTGQTTISSSSTLQLGNGVTDGAVVNSGTVNNGGALVFDTIGNQNLAGKLSGTGTVSMIGTGNQELSGSNDYTGATIVNSGTLQVGNTHALGNTPTITVSGSGALNLSNDLTPQTITLSGAGQTLSLASGASLAFGVANSGADELVISGGATMTVTGTITIDPFLLSGTGFNTYTTIISDLAGGLNNATFVLAPLPALSTGSITQTDTSVSITFTGVSTVYWAGSGTLNPGSWSDYTNFTSDAAGTVPLSGSFGPTQDVVFSGSNATLQNSTTVDYNATAHSLTINDPAGVLLGDFSQTLTLSGNSGLHTGINVTSAATGANEIATAVDLAGTPNITVNSTAGLLISGAISGSNGIIVNGADMLTLTGVNNFTGGTQLISGTLNVSADASFGASGSGNGVTFNPGAGNSVTLQASGLTTAGNRTFTFATGTGILDPGTAGNVMTIAGPIAGTAVMDVVDTGEVRLSGSVAFNGTALVSSGTLALTFPGTLAQTGTVTFDTAPGATLLLSANPSQNISPAAGDSVTFTGNGTLRVDGANGTLQMHGNTGVNGTAVYPAVGGIYMDMTGGTMEIANTGGTFQNGGLGATVAMPGNGVNGTGTPLWSGTLGDGITPFTNVAAMQIDSGASVDVWDGNTVTVDALLGSGTLTRTGYSNNEVSSVVVMGDNNGSGQFDGVITNAVGSVSLTKTGTGTEILTGNSSYSGSTLVTGGGTLKVTSNTGLGFGGQVYNTGTNEANGSVTVTGSSTLDINGGITVDKAVTLNGGSLINSAVATTSILDNGIAAVKLAGTQSGSYATPTLSATSPGTGSGATFAAGSTTDHSGAVGVYGAVATAGSGYTVAPGLAYTDSSGTGTGVTATAVLSSLTLAGNSNFLGGDGNLTINAAISGTSGFTEVGAGTLTFTGSVTYTGNTTISDGNLVNQGVYNIAAGNQLRIWDSSSGVSNSGTMNLSGAVVTGTASGLANNSGGSIVGYGTIESPFSNNAGATVSLTGGGLAITQAFTNAGTIQLSSLSANLTGGAITNNAMIQGFGSIGSDIANSGTIAPNGGTLILNGSVSNTSAGLISTGSGSEVLVNSGLATNSGTIGLAGGIFDNGGNAMNNAGQISGYGTLRVGTGANGLTNNGSIAFTSGSTTVNGDITNAAGKVISVSFYPATFTGNIINNGTFETTSAIVSFTGTFSNNGAYLSDPSVQNFASLAIGVNGSLVGGAGDVYKVTGNVTNNSTQAGAFNISGAKLTLAGTVNHQFTWSGADLGSTAAGYENNFAIGTLELQAGGSLTIEGESGTGAAGVGIYASVLQLDGGLAQIASITGNGADIYYDPTQAGNAYLGDQTYALQGGGEITAAIPEPGTVSLLTLGMIVGMGLLGRRKKH